MTNVFHLIHEALSHAGEDQQLVNRLSLLEERRITPGRVLPSMEFLFRLFGTPCFPRGELVGITGKPKSGKTFVSTVLMMLCFIDNLLAMARASPEPLRVLWLDTEQSDESTQDILLHRMMPMMKRYYPPEKCDEIDRLLFGDDDAGFHIFNVRQDVWQERLPLLEVAVERFKPDLVIVDGIRDLVNDINDGVLAQETVERLMHLASEQRCCVVCILHQNKSAEDRNLRGWIGTELTHKAFEVYECEKSDDRIFSFSQKLTRKYDIIDTLKYIVDEQGIPQLCSVEALLESEQRKRQQAGNARPELNRTYILEWNGTSPVFNLPLVMADALPEQGTIYVAKDMQEKIMKLTNITSPFFYNKLREQALSEGLIVRTTNAYGHVAYYRPQPLQQDLFSGAPGDAPF